MANEKTPVVWDDTTNKHRPLGTGEKMGGLDASSLLSSDSGNLLEAGSDGLAYLSGSGVVDPRADNLLEESDRGKLQVTIDRIAEWLDGHPEDASGLADAISGLLAAQLADGKTIVASGGKLVSDPTNATAAQKSAINSALADAASGLVVDPDTGLLQVDFSNMPTDRFEELMHGLKMQVPLAADAEFIVAKSDPNAGDDIVDGRGTEAKPFKTIQACVNYVTSGFALGRYAVRIRVKSGTYSESVALPQYDATSGAISLETYSGSRDVVINAPLGDDGFTSSCIIASSPSKWHVRNFTLRHVAVPGDVPSGGMTRVLLNSSGGGTVYSYGIKFELSREPGTFTHNYTVRVISADGGSVWMYPSATPFGFDVVANSSENFYCYVLAAQRDGNITLAKSSNSSYEFEIPCTGSCSTFARVFSRGSIQPFTTGTMLQFTGTVTGKRYEATSGSSINVSDQGADYFPGDVAGTVDSSTYCWYS